MPGELVVRVAVEGARAAVAGGHGAVHQLQHPAAGGLQVGGRHRALADRAAQRRLAGRALGHVEVVARGDRGGPVLDAVPVGDDRAAVAPLAAQDRAEQPGVLRGLHAVEPVVGAHHGPRVAAPDDPFEAAQVDLAQRALLDDRVHRRALDLGVVGREVLQRRADPVLLQPVDDRRGELRGEQRVLGVVLVGAPAERGAAQVDAGPEQHVDAELAALGRQGRAEPVCQRRVPGAGEGGAGREAGGRAGASPGGVGAVGAAVHHGEEVAEVEAALLVAVDLALGVAHAVGAVGHDDARHPEPRHGRRLPHPVARHQIDLLVVGERGEDRLHVEGHGGVAHGRSSVQAFPVRAKPSVGTARVIIQIVDPLTVHLLR